MKSVKKTRIWRTNNCKFTCASKKITRCHLQDEFNSSDPSTIQHRGHLLLVSSLLCTLEAAAQGLHLTLQGVNLQRSGASPMMPCCLGFDMFVPKFRKKMWQKLRNAEICWNRGGNSGEPPQFNYKLGWATLVERPWYRWCHWAAGSWCWFKPHKLGDGALAPKKHGEIDIQGWKLFHSDCIMPINLFNGPALARVGPKTSKDGQSVEFVENWRCQVRM